MPDINRSRWRNWAQNQEFEAGICRARDEEQVAAVIRAAAAHGGGVRVAGAGHSFTPLVEPRSTLLTLTGQRGVFAADADACRAEVWAHTPLRELGPSLWSQGLSLRNQGDTDAQTIAGAASTGTKGSGRRLPSISAEVQDLTLIDGRGDLVSVRTSNDQESADPLRAAKVSLGLLGVVTRIGLHVEPAYGLAESNTIEPLSEVLDHFEEELDAHRHYSFCWCPSDLTAVRFALPHTPADHCWVKRLDQVPASHSAVASDVGVAGNVGERVGRSYLIYPDWGDQEPMHIELEYMVPADRWQDAFAAVRQLMLSEYPDEHSMIQVRWQAADDAYLSAQFQRDSVSLAVVSDRTGNYDRFLYAFHEALLPFDPRPHWGKMHYFDHSLIGEAFPSLDRFLKVRQDFDPDGVFLNPYLEGLLGC